MKTYSEKLKDPRWQRKRLEVMQRDGFSCQNCGDDSATLNVHHWKYSRDPWDASMCDLVTFCEDCHSSVESLKKRQSEAMVSGGFRHALGMLLDFNDKLNDGYRVSTLASAPNSIPCVIFAEMLPTESDVDHVMNRIADRISRRFPCVVSTSKEKRPARQIPSRINKLKAERESLISQIKEHSPMCRDNSREYQKSLKSIEAEISSHCMGCRYPAIDGQIGPIHTCHKNI